MITRRTLLAASAVLAVAGAASGARAEAGPTATIDSFYRVLLQTMKNGKKLGFAGRQQALGPAIEQSFDLPLMTRLVVGLQWTSLSPSEQQQLVAAFSAFSIATYASDFSDYGGERFEVDPTPSPRGSDVVVHTKMLESDGTAVQLDYLLRSEQGGWRIIDVFLSGTISQLAARRSEFTAILDQQGPAGLIAVLKQKTAALAAGG